jgi:hypothetical protein
VLGYSGWGGLSIEGVMDQFPPGLVPDDFALAHEYFTPPNIAEGIADLVCPRSPSSPATTASCGRSSRASASAASSARWARRAASSPTRATRRLRWTAVELSDVSAKMFAAMRPDVELYSMSLERG